MVPESQCLTNIKNFLNNWYNKSEMNRPRTHSAQTARTTLSRMVWRTGSRPSDPSSSPRPWRGGGAGNPGPGELWLVSCPPYSPLIGPDTRVREKISPAWTSRKTWTGSLGTRVLQFCDCDFDQLDTVMNRYTTFRAGANSSLVLFWGAFSCFACWHLPTHLSVKLMWSSKHRKTYRVNVTASLLWILCIPHSKVEESYILPGTSATGWRSCPGRTEPSTTAPSWRSSRCSM